MPSVELRLKALEKKAAKAAAEIAKLKSELKAAQKANAAHAKKFAALKTWGEKQAKWSKEVTLMLRAIDWQKLAQAYPGGGGTNPPQTPPDWPGGLA